MQENVGKPDIDPDDRAAVERVIREEGPEIAQCRTGSALTIVQGRLPRDGPLPGPRLVGQSGTVELAALNFADGRERPTDLRALCRRML
jgi:hypothetical protein